MKKSLFGLSLVAAFIAGGAVYQLAMSGTLAPKQYLVELKHDGSVKDTWECSLLASYVGVNMSPPVTPEKPARCLIMAIGHPGDNGTFEGRRRILDIASAWTSWRSGMSPYVTIPAERIVKVRE